MKAPLILSCLALVASSAAVVRVSAQERIEFPAASPATTLQQRVGLTDFEIKYSRPSAKGRKIFGDLVKFGEPWRTGANNNTTIKFSDAVKFGDKEVPAGTYSLFTVPGEKEWSVMLSSDTKQWGTATYKKENEVANLKVTPGKLSDAVETLHIGLEDLTQDSAQLVVAWEKTRVAVKIGVPTASKTQKLIDDALASGKDLPGGFYSGAANFYFDNNKDLSKAIGWMDKAIEKNGKAWWLMRAKANMQIKSGDKKGAIATLKQAIEVHSASDQIFKAELEQDKKLLASLEK
ncbi:MAG: DUF2911 domain-containing protein [Verrucomicrobia bacterium]|nr:DUF2911 domain-containing protein [Verrucomicrobiota bacterium]